MILDEEYDKIKKLKIDAQHSEILSVNKGLWDKVLARFERFHMLGCMTIVVWVFILFSVFYKYFGFFAYLTVFFAGFTYKIINARQGTNLRKHADYEYEIGHDRVVRYGTAKYRILHFHEIVKVEEKRFGLLLWKEKPVANFSGLDKLNHTDERLMVIPKSLLSFEQVKSHILESVGEN